MKHVFSPGLCSLELRRTVWRVLVPTLTFLGLVMHLRSAPEVHAAVPFTSAAVARGLFREHAWTGMLLLLVPLAVFRAARLPAVWRGGEADWIGSRPIGRATALVSTWTGLGLALLLTLLAGSLWIESRVGNARAPADNPVFIGASPLSSVMGLDPGETLHLPLPQVANSTDIPLDERVLIRLRLTVLPGADPTSRVRLTARRPDGSDEAVHTTEGLIDGRTWLEVELPRAAGTAELELGNLGQGQVALLASPGIELWRTGGREQHASIALATRTGLGLLCATALAFAFATWIGSFTAGATVLVLWIAVLTWSQVPAWSPAPDLPRALGHVAEGRLPHPLDVRAPWTALAVCGAACCLAVRGLRSWRHAP